MARKRTWLDYFFGPWILRLLGIEYEKRPVLELVAGTGVELVALDVPDQDTTRLTISGNAAFQADGAAGDVQFAGAVVGTFDATPAVGRIRTAEVFCSADDFTEPRSKVGHVSTANNTPANVTLFTLADPIVLDLVGIVTVSNADASVRGRWSVAELAYRAGGGAAFQTPAGGEDAAPKRSDAGLHALLVVIGNTVALRVTGLPATDLTWGYEIRAQKQTA